MKISKIYFGMMNCPKCGLVPTATGTCSYCGSQED